jgi:hypothetical protein
MPRIDRELLGEAGLLDATTAIAIGIPATPGGGKQWQLSRAALLHSLACLGSCLGPTVPMPNRRTAIPRWKVRRVSHTEIARGVLQSPSFPGRRRSSREAFAAP